MKRTLTLIYFIILVLPHKYFIEECYRGAKWSCKVKYWMKLKMGKLEKLSPYIFFCVCTADLLLLPYFLTLLSWVPYCGIVMRSALCCEDVDLLCEGEESTSFIYCFFRPCLLFVFTGPAYIFFDFKKYSWFPKMVYAVVKCLELKKFCSVWIYIKVNLEKITSLQCWFISNWFLSNFFIWLMKSHCSFETFY